MQSKTIRFIACKFVLRIKSIICNSDCNLVIKTSHVDPHFEICNSVLIFLFFLINVINLLAIIVSQSHRFTWRIKVSLVISITEITSISQLGNILCSQLTWDLISSIVDWFPFLFFIALNIVFIFFRLDSFTVCIPSRPLLPRWILIHIQKVSLYFNLKRRAFTDTVWSERLHFANWINRHKSFCFQVLINVAR